jgi:hypothetical protein
LAYNVLHPKNSWQEWIYDWQPFLKRGLSEGVFRAGQLSADVVKAIWDESPDARTIEEMLQSRAEWMDDDTWGARMAHDLAVDSLRIVPHAGFKNVSLVVRVAGLAEPAKDTRLIRLARRAMQFKKTDHVLIEAGDQRFLIRLGDVCMARIDGTMRESIAPIEESRLAAVEEQGGGLGDLLGIEAA